MHVQSMGIISPLFSDDSLNIKESSVAAEEMTKFTGSCLTGDYYLPLGIKTHDDRIKHNDKMSPAAGTFYIILTTIFTT